MTPGVAEGFRDTSPRLGWRALAALRTHLLAACGVGTFAVGAAARYLNILVHHHPRVTVVSDAMPSITTFA